MKSYTVLAALVMLFSSINAKAEQATIWVFGGKAVSNSIKDTKSNAWGVYQETPTSLGRWDLGYLNEGHQHSDVKYNSGSIAIESGDKRDGIFALRDMQYTLNQRTRTSFAIGPYYTATTITDPNGVDYHDAYRLDLLAKASMKVDITSNISTEFGWWHVLYSAKDLIKNGRSVRGDVDVFTIALGYKF